MPFFIRSEERSDGDISDATFEFVSNISGVCTMSAQTFEPQEFPFLWSGVNTFTISAKNNLGALPLHAVQVVIDPSVGLMDDFATIGENIRLAIQDALDILPSGYERVVTFNYNAEDHFLEYTFDYPIQVFWEDVENNPFGYVISKTTSEGIVSLLQFSTQNMTLYPEHLECDIIESQTQVATSHNTTPTLILATSGTQITGQQFKIQSSTRTLHIKIYRPNIPYSVVPMTKNWTMYLK